MTREQLEQGNHLLKQIEELNSQLEKWDGSKGASELMLIRLDGQHWRVKPSFIDFDLLKEATIHKIKGELIDLKTQLAKI